MLLDRGVFIFHIHGFKDPLWLHNEVLPDTRKTFDDWPTSRLWRLCSAWHQQREFRSWSERSCFPLLATDWQVWFYRKQWVLRSWNAATQISNLSTASICYVRLCITVAIHPFWDKNLFIHAHKSICKFTNFSGALMENFIVPFMESFVLFLFLCSNCTALSLNNVIPHPKRSMQTYSQRGQVILTEVTLQKSTYPTVPLVHFYC